MDLVDLGFDNWFEQKWQELQLSEFRLARITRVDRGRYLIRNETMEVQAEVTGQLLYSTALYQDLPCVGDWVVVQYHNEGELAIIHQLLPRKTFLRRKSPGNKVDYQMIAANIDIAFLIQSCDTNFNLRRMERYLVIASEGHIEPVILLSKSDLIPASNLEEKIAEIRQARISAKVISFSNITSKGLDNLKAILEKGKTYCLLGSSGVGKTTLLNHLIGQELFETKPVREKDRRGRHATARRQMTIVDNGALLIDTPGMRELGMMAVSSSIDDSFGDIHQLSGNCRFNNCTHTTERGCTIIMALESGELDKDRYQSYLKLMKESKFHEMSYVEKRRKDKQFGRMVKTVLKHHKKR
jgi:ribosome biogenesis GTPase / thiamine phosphate phosphatase